MTDDVFAWAASLPQEHECVWVEHPTDEERQARIRKVVRHRPWWCPFIKVSRIELWPNVAIMRPNKQCAICDDRDSSFQDQLLSVHAAQRQSSILFYERKLELASNAAAQLKGSMAIATERNGNTSHTLAEACVFE